MLGPYVDHYLVPKRGSTSEQCEDAIEFSAGVGPDRQAPDPIVVVVCDGASESMLAGAWAGQLAARVVKQAAAHPGFAARRGGLAEAICAAAWAWADWTEGYVADRVAAGRPIAWYEQPKLEQGAYSTVLAVELVPVRPRPGAGDDMMVVADMVTEPKEWSWYAAALGDTCLFQVRDEQLVSAFPLDDAAAFSASPALAGSRNRDLAQLSAHTVLASGSCMPGDQVFLATDALAAWFLAEVGRGARPWTRLRDFAGRGQEEFAPWVEKQRSEHRMRNDDVALVHIDFG
jgi:hypothetical protein